MLADLDSGDPASAGVARDFTRTTLTGWGRDEKVFDAQLVISELVTNAIRHAGGLVQVRLLRDGQHVACVVTDSSQALPVMTEDDDCFAECGRGLHLVEALSACWGCIVTKDRGKLVWAVLNP
ncbi:ATP-binding protein [Thermocatellispora tengchongensis]|uniref:ATP-binding protein n=1 Tax=Thermocatellispora tengchongensis TaxID=1073253 RepID=UPI003636E678